MLISFQRVAIFAVYSNVNPQWIFTGKGDMLRCDEKEGICIDRTFVGHDLIGKVMGNINNNADMSQSDLLQEVIR
jgi:hypothetical protein